LQIRFWPGKLIYISGAEDMSLLGDYTVTPTPRSVTIQRSTSNVPQNPKLWKHRFFGGFSFEAESLPEFSEFDDGSDTVDCQNLR